MRTSHKNFLFVWVLLAILITVAFFWLWQKYRYPATILQQTATSQVDLAPNSSVGTIDDFFVTMNIKRDGSIGVEEKITYNSSDSDFSLSRRLLSSVKYAGGVYNFPINNVSVVDANGQAIAFTQNKTTEGWSLLLGSDGLAAGQNVLKLSYDLSRAINFFPDKDELFWQITGGGFDLPIDRIGVLVKLPDGTDSASLSASCLVENVISDCQITNITASQVGYSLFRELAPGQNLQVVLSWPKGVLSAPTAAAKTSWLFFDNPLLFLPLVVALLMFALWYFHGRDLSGKFTNRTIVTKTPNDYSPAVVGTMRDERFDLPDLIGEFFHLATENVLSFKKDTNSYKLILNDKITSAKLTVWQKVLLSTVFMGEASVTFSQVNVNLRNHLLPLKAALYEFLVQNGYFPESPKKVRNFYTIVALLFIVIGFSWSYFIATGLNAASFFVSAIIVFWLGQYMPYKTVKGSELSRQIFSYKNYLKSLATNNLNAQELTQHLPYALTFGSDKKLLTALAGKLQAWPEWLKTDQKFNQAEFTLLLSSIKERLTTIAKSGFGR